MSERVIWLMKFGIHHIPQSHTHQRRLQRKKVTTPKIWVIICASSHAIWRRRGLTQRYGMRHGVHEGVFAGRGAFLLGKRVQTVRVRSVAATDVTSVYQTDVTSAAPTDTLCLCSNVSVGPADIKSVWATDVTSVASGRLSTRLQEKSSLAGLNSPFSSPKENSSLPGSDNQMGRWFAIEPATPWMPGRGRVGVARTTTQDWGTESPSCLSQR
ncbi:hypothetical protein PCANC_10139 [Puccinia coronata f. sp. avenae]|uniref:Uncharacterized protein n=1 Tax=Puccinia coronata f. sp. avenae TaxID=200324 RepID=A0A2N5V675_9BASI|nr:hypothetical protein PCANC_10139 [Puccinia coronata f. sp. avenae]